MSRSEYIRPRWPRNREYCPVQLLSGLLGCATKHRISHKNQCVIFLDKSFDMSCLNPYYCAPMLDSTLPEHIKPVKFARRGTTFNGQWSLDKFKRLTENAVSCSGEVNVQADITLDDGVPVLQGSASTSIELECQRCLETVSVALNVPLKLVFVASEENAAEVPDPFEAVLLEEEEISLLEVVEEELILALPIVAYHDVCDAYDYQQPEDKAAEAETPKENPFGVLEQLKGKLKSEKDED